MSNFLICFSVIVLLASCGNTTTGTGVYPLSRKEVQVTSLFGKEVKDEYAGLQNLESPKVINWFQAQDSLAEVYFSQDPLMSNYLKRFEELQNISKGSISMIRVSEEGNYFYLKYDEPSGLDHLFYKKNLQSPEQKLFDPSKFPDETIDITYLNPSYDGSRIAIGYRNEESFASKILLLNVEKKLLLEDIITNVNPDFGGVEWLPDNSGFIYLYFPVVDQTNPRFKRGSFSVIHLIGDDPLKRTPIFGKSQSVPIPEDFYPKVKIGSSQDKFIIGYSANSNDFYDAYITTITEVLKGDPHWKPFFTKEHGVFYNQGEVRNEEFIFRRGIVGGNQIAKVDISSPQFDSPDILAEGTTDNPITEFIVSKNKIVFSTAKNGVEVSLWEIDGSRKLTQLNPPFLPGYASFYGNSVTNDFVGVELDGWISDYSRYIISPEGEFLSEGLQEENDYSQFENLVTEQILVKSHDGVEVPLSLVYRKDLNRNSGNEVFMYVYGAYGESMSPFFYPIFLDWAVQGGVLAFPHVRGGGEKGKDWHIQGMKQFKYNSWKDLIACTEALIEEKITREGLVSIYTTSAGGITAGMAINERPDLYSSFIADVPRLNPLGLESSATASSTSYLEYGTVKDSVEYIGLINMDPYLNINPELAYPAVLIMPSSQDDRIPLWDSGKYIAKLQNTTATKNPILLDIDFVSGHGNYGHYDETIKLYSKIFSFAKGNMNKN